MAHTDYHDLRPDGVREVEVFVEGARHVGDLEAIDKLDGL